MTQAQTHAMQLFSFDGFYESIHNQLIDDGLEQMFMNDDGECEMPDAFWVAFYITPELRAAYCKAYVDIVKDYLKDALDLDLPSMTFKEVISPREYNFQTDRVLVAIDETDLAKLEARFRSDSKPVHEAIAQFCTSRSGFHSFYSNDPESWEEKPVADWDHIELGILLEGVTGGWNDVDLMTSKDTFHETVANLLDEHMPVAAKRLFRAYANARIDQQESAPSL